MGSRLRVLMTADTVGGVFSYAVTLARALAGSPVDVVIATLGNALRPDQREELATIPRLEIRESTFALEWMDDPWASVDASGEWLRRLEKELTPDIIHLNGYAHAALDFAAPTVVVAHSSVTTWWRAVLGEEAPERYAEYRRRVGNGLARAARVVAPTRAMLEALASHDGFCGEASVIPNGAEPHSGSIPVKEPFCLAAGRLWDRAKNLALIAQAAPTLPWPVRVAGDLASAGAPPQVEFLGQLPRDELVSWMKRAAIFLHPARYEPFGLAPLEAAYAGCALVLGDIDSLHEVWGEAAEYVHPDDTEGLASTLRRLTSDAERLGELGMLARGRAAKYGAERMAQAYLNLYRELVSRRTWVRFVGRPS